MANVEIDNSEFDLLIKDKRHKELISILKSILKNLDGVNKETTRDLLELLISKSDTLPTSIQSIATVIIAKMEELHDKDREWEFEVNRNDYGYITTVTAKRK